MLYEITVKPLPKEQTIDLPSSKSLSNRALIIQALCHEKCTLERLSDCDDTRVLQAAFDGTEKDTIDIGAAGTSMRFLTAYLACTPGKPIVLTGSKRMKERPIGILVDALRKLGADIEYTEQEGYPPLRISGKQLDGGPLSIDGSISSQYISALLLIAPTLTQGLKLTLEGQITSRPYIEMTLALMRQFGIDSSFQSNVISIKHQDYQATNYSVESDWSAASYWYEILFLSTQLKADASAQAPQQLTLLGLKSNSLQGDSRVAKYFAELGIATTFTAQGAILTPTQQPLPAQVNWDLSNQPDLAQTLITTCCGGNVAFKMTGLHTLRIKETDRLYALHKELHKLGFDTQIVGDDEMNWNHQQASEPLEDEVPGLWAIETYKDHRMAMAFAPLALWAQPQGQALYIDDPTVVSKSYPKYWDDLLSLNFHLETIGRPYAEFLAHVKATSAKQARVHKHAKIVLNTLLVSGALLLIYYFFIR